MTKYEQKFLQRRTTWIDNPVDQIPDMISQMREMTLGF